MADSMNELVCYRYERASEELENAKVLLETGKYKLPLNRSYFLCGISSGCRRIGFNGREIYWTCERLFED